MSLECFYAITLTEYILLPNHRAHMRHH